MTFFSKLTKTYLFIFLIFFYQITNGNINNYLDRTFGSDGNGIILNSQFTEIIDIAVLDNGYLICGCMFRTRDKSRISLICFDQDGFLNKNFGIDGIVNTKISDFDFLNAITITQDNKILITGSTFANGKTSVFIAKYNDNGVLDKSFGNNGIVITSLFTGASGNTICVGKDNKIIVSGGVVKDGIGHIFIASYNANGSIDENFGNQGIILKLINDQSGSNFMLWQKPDKVIIAGYSRNAKIGLYDTILMRYNENGTIDTSFGINGIAVLNIPNASLSSAISMKFCSDESILVLGSTNKNTINQIFLAKFTKDGKIDINFGSNNDGICFFNCSNKSYASDVAIDENENIFFSGDLLSELNEYRFCIFKLNSKGEKDLSFGDDGCITTKIGNNARTNAIILQNNYPIVAGITDNNMAIVKYLSNNEPFIKIANFNNLRGSNGQISINGSCSTAHSSVLIKIDNKIIDSIVTDDKGNWKINKSYFLCNGQHQIDASFIINDKIFQTKKNITINANDHIAIESPKNNSYITKNKLKISGFCSQANKYIKIIVDGILFKEILTDQSGRWSAGILPNILGNGKHKINAILIDDAQEIVKANCNIIVNRLNNISVNIPAKNSKVDSASTNISGKSNLPNAEVIVYLNDEFISLINTDDSGNWQTKIPAKIRSGINIACAKLIDPNNGSTLASANINFYA